MNIQDLLDKKKEQVDAANIIRDRVYKEQEGEWRGDDHAKFDELMDSVEAISQDVERMAKLDAAERSLTEEAKPLERRTAPAISRQSQARRTVGKPTPEDRALALQGWIARGAGDDDLITDQHIAAAQRCGMQLSQREIKIQLAHRPPRLEQRDVTKAAVTQPLADEMMGALEISLQDFGGMREVSRVIRTPTGNDLPWPTMNDSAFAATIIGEGSDLQEQDPTFGLVTLNSFKYSSHRIDVSLEFLQDASFNVPQVLGEMLGERIGRGTNAHFTTGTGSGQPNGVVTASSAGVTAAANSAITYNEIIDLKHSVDPAYRRRGARFMFSDDTLKALKKIKIEQYSGDTSGQPLWRPGMAQAEPNTIDGDPYTINQDVADIGTLAISMLYGDFSKYIIRDVMDIRLVRLDERYAELGLVAFVAISRHDGDLLDAGTDPVKHLVHPT